MKSFFSPALWGSLNITRQIEHIAFCFLVSLLVGILGNLPVASVSSTTYYIGVDTDNLTASHFAAPAAIPTSLTYGSAVTAAICNTTLSETNHANGACSHWHSACILLETYLSQAENETSDFGIVA